LKSADNIGGRYYRAALIIVSSNSHIDRFSKDQISVGRYISRSLLGTITRALAKKRIYTNGWPLDSQ